MPEASATPASSCGARGQPPRGVGRAQGGLFLAMFQIPNKFFRRDGRVTDFRGKDWQKTWGGDEMNRFLARGFPAPAWRAARAQDYPAKPIVVIVPAAAGGPTDTLTRVLAAAMGEALGSR